MEDEKVFWNLELKVKPGKLETLKSLANEMTEATLANEPGTIDYIWSMDAGGEKCHIFERYVDSDAVRVHMGNFEAFRERFFDCMDIERFQVYGYPDEALAATMTEMGCVLYNVSVGFAR